MIDLNFIKSFYKQNGTDDIKYPFGSAKGVPFNYTASINNELVEYQIFAFILMPPDAPNCGGNSSFSNTC